MSQEEKCVSRVSGAGRHACIGEKNSFCGGTKEPEAQGFQAWREAEHWPQGGI